MEFNVNGQLDVSPPAMMYAPWYGVSDVQHNNGGSQYGWNIMLSTETGVTLDMVWKDADYVIQMAFQVQSDVIPEIRAD